MITKGSSLNGITSDELGTTRIFGIGDTMQHDDLFSEKVNATTLGLIRLEKQVIALTMDGFSTEETAKRIGISKVALRLHFKSIYDKLGVSNQFELILFALYHHLIDTYEISRPYN